MRLPLHFGLSRPILLLASLLMLWCPSLLAQVDSVTMVEIKGILAELTSKKELEYVGKLKISDTKADVYNYQDYESRKQLEKKYEAMLKAEIKRKTGERSNIDTLDFWLAKKRKEFLYQRVRSVEVDSIEISVVEGVIDNVRVSAGNTIFTNRGRPISLVYFDREDKMLLNLDGSEYIKLGEILQYLNKIDRHYVPDDELLVLTRKSPSSGLKASVDLNSSVELRVFSDLLGLFGEQGNGLVQTELNSKIFANTVPYSSKIGSFFIGNFVEPYFRYAKFDTKYSEVVISDTTSRYSVTDKEQLLMNQQSFINLGIRVNMGRVRISNTFVEMNAGLEYGYARVRPANESEYRTGNLGSGYLELRGGISRSKNFGLTYALDYYFQVVQNNQFEAEEGTIRKYIRPMFELFHHPRADPSNKIFIRFQTFVDVNSNLSYANLQLGYSARLGIANKRLSN